MKKWNTNSKNEIWIQNDDSTVFNANIAKTFFSKKIENKDFKNLEIEWKNKTLSLWNVKENRPVRVFDTGIISPQQRSKMFQLLKVFGASHVSFSFLCKIVNELFTDLEWYRQLPRITIDNHLVIQRSMKYLSAGYFPNLSTSYSKKEFYEILQFWRKQTLKSDIVFIKLPYRPHSKPQLIDFKSPLSMQSFQKILNSKPKAILFEEMLPNKGNILDSEFCNEIVIQWKKER